MAEAPKNNFWSNLGAGLRTAGTAFLGPLARPLGNLLNPNIVNTVAPKIQSAATAALQSAPVQTLIKSQPAQLLSEAAAPIVPFVQKNIANLKSDFSNFQKEPVPTLSTLAGISALQKKQPFEFKVGENLTPLQQVVAQNVINKNIQSGSAEQAVYKKNASVADKLFTGIKNSFASTKEADNKELAQIASDKARIDSYKQNNIPAPQWLTDRYISTVSKRANNQMLAMFSVGDLNNISKEALDAAAQAAGKQADSFVGSINKKKYDKTVGIMLDELGNAGGLTNKKFTVDEVKQMASQLEGTPTLEYLSSMPEGQLRAEVHKLRSELPDTLLAKLKESQAGDIRSAMEQAFGYAEKQSRTASEIGGALQIHKESIPENQALLRELMRQRKIAAKDPILSQDIDYLSRMDKAIGQIAGNKIEFTSFDKFYEFWINSVLSNPKTHMVNITGNTVNLLKNVPERYLQAGFELFRGANKEVTFSEANAYTKGLFSGIEDGMWNLANHFLGSTDAPAGIIGKTVGTALENTRGRALTGIGGDIINVPTALLGVSDDFFKSASGSAELYAQATRTAIAEGLTGAERTSRVAELIANPTKDILAKVTEHMNSSTFQTELGSFGKKVMSLREGDTVGAHIMKLIAPFVRTPTNIMKEAVRMSPAGLIDVAKNTGASRTASLSKVALGTAVELWAASKFIDGKITGAVPRDPDERDAFYRVGMRPYSIKIGDKWVSYAKTEPIATILGNVADVMNYAKDNNQKDATKLAGDLTALIVRNLSDKTYMAGLSSVVQAINDPVRYGDSWIGNMASGFIPFSGALSFAAQLQSKYIRDPEGLLQKLESRIPFLQERVPKKRDVFGTAITREKSDILPVSWNTEHVDAIESMLKNADLVLPMEPKELYGFRLTTKQANFLKKQVGTQLHETLNVLSHSPSFTSAPPKAQAEQIMSIYSMIKGAATESLIAPFVKEQLAIKESDKDVYAALTGIYLIPELKQQFDKKNNYGKKAMIEDAIKKMRTRK